MRKVDIKMKDLVEDKPTPDSQDRISHLKIFLEQTNPTYRNITKKIRKIKEKNPKMEQLYDGETMILSKDDCKDLQKIINLQYELLPIQENAIEGLGAARTLDKLSMLLAFDTFVEENKKREQSEKEIEK